MRTKTYSVTYMLRLPRVSVADTVGILKHSLEPDEFLRLHKADGNVEEIEKPVPTEWSENEEWIEVYDSEKLKVHRITAADKFEIMARVPYSTDLY